MRGLDSKDLEKWGAAPSRHRSPLRRHARFRLRELLTALCGFLLILGLAAHNAYPYGAIRTDSSWTEVMGAESWLGKTEDSTDKVSTDKVQLHHLPADMDEFESLATSIGKNFDADEIQYREIFALTPMDRKFMLVNYNKQPVTDPMLLPHPTEHDMWVVLARRARELSVETPSDEHRTDDKPAEVQSPKEEPPKEVPTKEQSPKEESPKEESPKEESSNAESPKAESPKAESPKEESAKEESPKAESPKAESPKEESAKEESPKEESPKEESPKEESPKEESPKEESPKEESPKEESTKEGSEQEEQTNDQSSKEASTKESSTQEEADKKTATNEPPADKEALPEEAHLERREEQFVDEQVVCPAARWNEHDGFLDCISDITPITQPSLVDEACKGKTDARIFYGPDVPFVSYGPRHKGDCSGGWTQDARSILTPFHFQEFLGPRHFHNATRMGHLEDLAPADSKSFYFWDGEGEMYVHRSLFPRRVFGKIHANGAVSQDLAQTTRHVDQVCYGNFMPEVVAGQEHLEQATNSLSITMCERKDPKCVVNDNTTFIMSIFHIKSSVDETLYKPYVVLFRRSAPFFVHAIATRPLWVHGRPDIYSISSMSWKRHSQKYHGYIDDPVFLGLTVGSSQSGAIDLLAADILQDLGIC